MSNKPLMTPMCILCCSDAVCIVKAPNGCTCAANIYQPRCAQHLYKLRDSDWGCFDIVEIINEEMVKLVMNTQLIDVEEAEINHVCITSNSGVHLHVDNDSVEIKNCVAISYDNKGNIIMPRAQWEKIWERYTDILKQIEEPPESLINGVTRAVWDKLPVAKLKTFPILRDTVIETIKALGGRI